MANRYMGNTETEAQLFGHYLLQQPVPEAALQLYATALAAKPGTAGRQEVALLGFATQHPWSLGLLDAGAALVRPNAELRRRLFIMFSILETMPTYADYFLPKKHSWWQVVGVFLTGCKAAAKVLCGAVLVKVIAR